VYKPHPNFGGQILVKKCGLYTRNNGKAKTKKMSLAICMSFCLFNDACVNLSLKVTERRTSNDERWISQDMERSGFSLL
jgi:hypothetical protein